MSSSRTPSSLTFIGSRPAPSVVTNMGTPDEPSGATYIANTPMFVDRWGCILCGEGGGFGPTNIMWDDGDAVYWDGGGAVLSDD